MQWNSGLSGAAIWLLIDVEQPWGLAHGLPNVGQRGRNLPASKTRETAPSSCEGHGAWSAKGTAMMGIQPQRNVILAAGTLAAMGTSCIYMWSIFNKPLMATYGFSASEVSMAYSLFLLTTCFSSMLAGWLQQRIQPRYIVVCSGVLFGMGWFLSGFASNLAMLYLFFGGFAGAGNGLLYNTIVAVVMKWFPDKRGFARRMHWGDWAWAGFLCSFGQLSYRVIQRSDGLPHCGGYLAGYLPYRVVVAVGSSIRMAAWCQCGKW